MAFFAGFVFAVRIVIVLLAVRVLGADARAGSAVVIGLNFSLLGLVCFHSLGNAERTFGSMVCLPSIRWMLAFLALSSCSFFWSETASPSASTAYWCSMAADVATVAVLLRAAPASSVGSSVMKGFVWGACCLALIAWAMPAQADLRLGDEDYFNANQIGNLCAVAIFLAQYLLRRKDGNWGPAILFLAVTLLRSLSKATIVAFAVSEGFLILRDGSMTRKTKMLLVSAAGLAILLFWGLLESYYVIYTNAGNQAETLTGRLGIWAYVLNAAVERPWIGHGFDSMWKIVPPFGPDRFEVRHAENEVLQQFYAYGVAGVCILAGLYASLYRQFRRLPSGSPKIVLVSLLLFVIVRGLAEAEPFDLLLPLWAVVLFSLLAEQLRISNQGDGVALQRA
jgi:O-antigen ligase